MFCLQLKKKNSETCGSKQQHDFLTSPHLVSDCPPTPPAGPSVGLRSAPGVSRPLWCPCLQAQWDGLTGHIVLNKTDGLRRDFDLDIISLKEDGTARVSQTQPITAGCVSVCVCADCFLPSPSVAMWPFLCTSHLLESCVD